MVQSTTKRIAKNFSWLMAGSIVSGGAGFLTIVYLARVLGAAAFGLFQFVQAFLLYLVVVVDSGLSLYGTREIAIEKNRTGQIAFNILVLRLLIAFVFFLASIVVIAFIPLAQEIRWLFIITFLAVFHRAMNTEWVFQGLEKMEYVAFSRGGVMLLSFFVIVLLVKDAGDLLIVPLIQLVIGSFFSLLFIIILFKKHFTTSLADLMPDSWWKIFLLSFPLGASIVFMLICDNMDTILLGFMTNPMVVGYYSAAYRILYIVAGVMSVWSTVVFPVFNKKLVESNENAERFMDKYMRLTMLAALPLIIFIFLFAPLIILFVFGSQYNASIIVLQVLIWSVIPMVIGNTYGSLILISKGYFKQYLWTVAVGALVNVVINLMLIPLFGAVGSAIAMISACLVSGLLALYFSRKIFNLSLIRYVVKPGIIVLLSFVAYFFACWLFNGYGNNLRIAMSSVTFIIVSVVLILVIERGFIFDFAKEVLRAR